MMRFASWVGVASLVAGCTSDADDLFGKPDGTGGAGASGGAPVTTGSTTAPGTMSGPTTATTTTTTTTTGVTTSTTVSTAVSTGGPFCGNGAIDALEECDGLNLGGLSCADYGYVNAGGLTCTPECKLDPEGCEGVCGNFSQEPDEACDDGNLTSGDGCSATCQLEGETCSSPLAVSLGLGTTILFGATTGGNDQYQPLQSNACPDGSGPERIYAVTPQANGFLTVWLASQGTNFDAVAYLRNSCNDPASQILCEDNFGTATGGGGEAFSLPAIQGTTVYVFVDGYAGLEGDYELWLDLSVGDTCADPVPLVIEGTSTIRGIGSTTGFANDVQCSTGAGATGGDIVYEVTFTDADTYTTSVTAGYNSVLQARSACGDLLSQLGCSSPAGNDSQLQLTASAGQTTYFWVDGAAGETGSYTISFSH
jgi:cysteine-rich repeat protein